MRKEGTICENVQGMSSTVQVKPLIRAGNGRGKS